MTSISRNLTLRKKMITLTGKLRQASQVEYDNNKKTKLWVEHEMERDSGPPDLRIEELFLEGWGLTLPGYDEQVCLVVRPYPSAKGIKFQAVKLLPLSPPSKPAATPPGRVSA